MHNIGDRVTVPPHLLRPRGSSSDHYVLRVIGDSMIDESIRDGDYVIVLRRDHAEPGEMVVCCVGDDPTIKRWYLEEDGVTARLEPANPALPPIRVPARDVKIQGIVVGLMRKF